MRYTRMTLSVMGLAALLGVSAGCSESPDAHYRKHHDGKSLYAVLYKQVKPGDSMEKVQSLLGPGKTADRRTHSAIKKVARKTPDLYPDSYQEDDVLLSYPMGEGATAILQFRGGKLINHNPEDCAHYEPMINSVSSRPASRPAPR